MIIHAHWIKRGLSVPTLAYIRLQSRFVVIVLCCLESKTSGLPLQVVTMPAPMNTVVEAATEETTPMPPPSSSSTNWWIVVIIVMLSIAIVVVALLVVVWYRRIRRSGSVGVPTPVHSSQPYVTVSQVTVLVSCTMSLSMLSKFWFCRIGAYCISTLIVGSCYRCIRGMISRKGTVQ